MAEHLIRLRGAWELHEDLDDPAKSRRVDLPAIWPAELRSPFRLSRRFHRPMLDRGVERLILRMKNVCGLRWVRVNAEFYEIESGADEFERFLDDDLPARNELVLHVERASAGNTPLEGGAWGRIALVILHAE